ncbi:hypothetical protein V7150_17265 [Neobacillus drentensis]|uniref:hypothetical protein n=1 Tax=Neobacillus drentensis TaxID=220684 RepID=UPI003000AF2B
MGQINRTYRFRPYEDLKNKSALFKHQFEEMGRLGYEMVMSIEKELASSLGRIVDESLKALLQNHKENESIINRYISQMDLVADRYSQNINDMKEQSITIYYEEVEISAPK